MSDYKFHEFRENEEDWPQYEERFGQHLIAAGVSDKDRVRAIFLSSVGGKTYGVLRSLIAPHKPADLDLENLQEALRKHYAPKPSPIVERCRFNMCVRKQCQSVNDFVAELRKISEHCEYGPTLSEMIRDRLVAGINDEAIQKRLLSTEYSKLDLRSALDICLAMEAASKNTLDLRQTSCSSAIHKISKAHAARSARPSVQVKQVVGTPNSTGLVDKKWNPCYRCGKLHDCRSCPAKDMICHGCQKKGHVRKMCKSRKEKASHSKWSVNKVENEYCDTTDEQGDPLEGVYDLFSLDQKGSSPEPYCVQLTVNGQEIPFEIDTGSSLTVMTRQSFDKYFCNTRLDECPAQLRCYFGFTQPAEGMFVPEVSFKSKFIELPCTVVRNSGPNLLGRDWLNALGFRPEHCLYHLEPLQDVLNRYPVVFSDDMGKVSSSCKINMKQESVPKFFKARPIPLALRSKVDQELSRLVDEGILNPVQNSDWAAPIVPVEKSDGTIRICGDYKVTVNSNLVSDYYPLPLIDDLYAKLAGGTKFTKLDMKGAYLQFPIEPACRKFTTINTPRGLFEYTRLPFGIASAPSIFQKVMDDLFRDMPRVCAYLDDILITGVTDEEHIENLEEVLRRLEKAGLRLNRDKCSFMSSNVEYLGHRIDAAGLHPTKKKLEAITKAPVPTDVTQLKAYLGLINYYGRFLRNLATELSPLYELLQKQKEFRWTDRHQEAFEKSKRLIEASQLLVFYNPELPLVLTTDSSSYGLGAVLSHTINGIERPIYCASRTLSPSEKNYSQLEKESLSVVFGVKRFHQYLYGRRFLICNDHRPLEGLLGERKGIPVMASGRIRRWALTLSAYNYEFRYKAGKNIPCADALSRLPLPGNTSSTTTPIENVHSFDFLSTCEPLTSREIMSKSRNDPVLSKVITYTLSGDWPMVVDDEFRPFYNRRTELSCEQGCLMWGSRVVIPPRLRTRALEMLHEGHPGIVKMKAIARSYMYWPNIDRDLEHQVHACSPCQQGQAKPAKVPLNHWPVPERPWATLHADFAGPLKDGKMILVLVDAYSRFIDAFVCNSSTSETTIQKFRQSFATHGLCDTLITDNGPCFASLEFSEFVRKLGIKHVKVAPYHPASNGLAEKAVHVVKKGVSKLEGSLELRLTRFLFKYRNTPHSTTNETPAKLLFNRCPITPLDRIRPSVRSRIEEVQQKQKQFHDKSVLQRKFSVDDLVYVMNYGKGVRWLPGKVLEVISPVTFHVLLDTGVSVKKHAEQLRRRYEGGRGVSDSPATDRERKQVLNPNVVPSSSITPLTIPASGSIPEKVYPSGGTPEKVYPGGGTPEKAYPSGSTQEVSSNSPTPEVGTSKGSVAEASPSNASSLSGGLRRSKRDRKPRVIFDL